MSNFLGFNIKKYRNDQGLSQEELAEKVGISRVALGNYERSSRTPNATNLQKIALALNVSINDLLGRREATQEDIDKLYGEPNSYINRTNDDNNEIVEAAFVVSNYFFKEEPKTAEIYIMINNKDPQGMIITKEKKILLKDRFSDKDYLKYKIQRYENLLEKILNKDKDKDYLDHKMSYYKGLQNPKTIDDTPESEYRESTQEDIDKLFD